MDSKPQNPIIDVIKQTLSNKLVGFQVEPSGHVVDREWQVRPLYATRSKDNYSSTLYVAERNVAADRPTAEELASLIVKVLPENPTVRVVQNSDKQFHNERNMFLYVIPLMSSTCSSRVAERFSSLFPKCYYADCDPINAMIVLENLQNQRYELTELLLDYDHCEMALEGLARFHAVSYAMKHKCKSEFKTHIVDGFVEARFCEQNKRRQNVYMRYTSLHPVKLILDSDDEECIKFRDDNASFLRRLEAAFERPVDLLLRSVLPEEPLAVLCHGDFNRNNIMFRHDDDRKLTHVKLLDFQTVRYANPGTDLVSLFCLNTTAELRSAHLDDLLSAYQKTLVGTLLEMEVAPRGQLEHLYSLSAIREDYESHALLGYVMSAMFSHFMLATTEEMKELVTLKQLETTEEPSEQYLKCVVGLGGEEATRRSVAIVKEMAAMRHCFNNQ